METSSPRNRQRRRRTDQQQYSDNVDISGQQQRSASTAPVTRLESFKARYRSTNPRRYFATICLYAVLILIYFRILLYSGRGRTLRPIQSLPEIPNGFIRDISSTAEKDASSEKIQRLINKLPSKEEMVRSVEGNGIDPRGLANVRAWNGWIEASHKVKAEVKRLKRLKKGDDKLDEEGGKRDLDLAKKSRENLVVDDKDEHIFDEGDGNTDQDAAKGVNNADVTASNANKTVLDAETLQRARKKIGRKQKKDPSRLLPFLIIIMCCTLTRTCLAVLLDAYADALDRTTDGDDVDAMRSSFVSALRQRATRMPRPPTTAELRAVTRRARRARFRVLVDRLNAARAQNGQRPISSESLMLVMTERNFTGDDYESLLAYDEENGPALDSLTSSIGATEEEIARCPDRIIQNADDDLMKGGPGGTVHNCAVCLHPYQVGERVRTIPCFHTFHVDCIDPWLARKAECPVCKHHAVP